MRTRCNRFAPQQRIDNSCLRSGNAAGNFAQRRMCWSGAAVGAARRRGCGRRGAAARAAVERRAVRATAARIDRSQPLRPFACALPCGGAACPSAFRTTALLLPTLGAELAFVSTHSALECPAVVPTLGAELAFVSTHSALECPAVVPTLGAELAFVSTHSALECPAVVPTLGAELTDAVGYVRAQVRRLLRGHVGAAAQRAAAAAAVHRQSFINKACGEHATDAVATGRAVATVSVAAMRRVVLAAQGCSWPTHARSVRSLLRCCGLTPTRHICTGTRLPQRCCWRSARRSTTKSS